MVALIATMHLTSWSHCVARMREKRWSEKKMEGVRSRTLGGLHGTRPFSVHWVWIKHSSTLTWVSFLLSSSEISMWQKLRPAGDKGTLHNCTSDTSALCMEYTVYTFAEDFTALVNRHIQFFGIFW